MTMGKPHYILCDSIDTIRKRLLHSNGITGSGIYDEGAIQEDLA
jgi:hypothetical protein